MSSYEKTVWATAMSGSNPYSSFPSYLATTLIVLFALSVLLYKATYPNLHPREPSIIHPKPPIIGHLYGIITQHAMYFKHLYDANPSFPIATLPTPTHKLYCAFTPELQQACARSRNFVGATDEFTAKMFGVEQRVVDAIMGTDGVHESIEEKVTGATGKGLSGEGLKGMNVRALKHIESCLNAVDPVGGVEVPNLYMWIRSIMSTATSKALFGDNSPYREPGLIDSQWTFESNMRSFSFGAFPAIIARKAYKARARVHAALERWYGAEYDQNTDVDSGPADIVRSRGALMRGHGLTAAEFSKLELSVMHGATSNTIPTLYWLLTFVFLRPKLVEELRDEALTIVGGEPGRGGVVEILGGRLEESSPLLVSCFRETIRLASQPITSRRVARDFDLVDPVTGRAYLLRKGADVLLPTTVLHRLPSVWGDKADEFDPRRFLAVSKEEDEVASNKRRNAYMPFGGGKHMCPGRHFAIAENLGFMTALVSGFEIEGLRSENVEMANAKLGEAIAKPSANGEGGRVVLRRRKGWEEVVWKYVV